jgi:hypothetical protein
VAFAAAGEVVRSPQQLGALGLGDLLGDVFAAWQDRPTVVELLRRVGLTDPLAGVDVIPRNLEGGRGAFDVIAKGLRDPS